MHHGVKQSGVNARSEAPWDWPRSVYVHVPFCAHRCGYCDFATVAGMDQLIDRYLDALDRELATVSEPQAVETLFIGGGTPTQLDRRQLARLLRSIRRWFIPQADYEWTVEANPGTLDGDKVDVLAEYGVNRVSLGAQTFHVPLLQVLERNHEPADVCRAVDRIRRRISNVSIDLIFGIPGQTLAQWQTDLRRALDLGLDHMSTYGLTYEKGTRLWKQRQQGLVTPVRDSVERDMYTEAMDRFAAAGWNQYEISNFARPGRECRHNLVYWANHAYFGFGLGAARYIGGRRETNTRDINRYIRCCMSGQSAVQQFETLTPEARARETAALQLRRNVGIVRDAFHRQTGFQIDALASEAIVRHRDAGWLTDGGEAIHLTREGRFFADCVIADFLVP